jgi:type IX secretion system PorP/SprF family membrane protein
MKNFILILILISCFSAVQLKGQTFHFSQFQMAPHLLNPALTGNYVGTLRLGFLYRNQWSNFMSGYSTPTFFIDGPIGISFGKHDWLGGGGVVVTDRAGSGRLSTGGFLFSGVYHKGFGTKGQNVISLGLQYGVMSRRIRLPTGLQFYDALEDGGQSRDLTNLQNDNQRNNKMVIGMTYTYKYDQEDRLQFGFSATNFTRRGNNITFMSGGGGYFQKPHFIGFASFDRKVTDVITIRPFVQFQLMDKFFELSTLAMVGYKINKEEDISVNAGLGYRLGESGIVSVGMDYKTLRVGLAYDLNLTSLSLANSFELGVTYIIRIIKKPKVRPVIFCPRL